MATVREMWYGISGGNMNHTKLCEDFCDLAELYDKTQYRRRPITWGLEPMRQAALPYEFWLQLRLRLLERGIHNFQCTAIVLVKLEQTASEQGKEGVQNCVHLLPRKLKKMVAEERCRILGTSFLSRLFLPPVPYHIFNLLCIFCVHKSCA